ncbi:MULTISPECIES: hypothetical protein [unclassified Frankia]|uniref:hypothetical protein n=1 Tax=unclassified Frankia TaxID=2632575 RepID=UPI002024F72C
MSEVALDWALIGKAPGQREDYSLLRSGSTGRLRPGSMAKMVNHFSPGSPRSPVGEEQREGADALPWVTFTFATAATVRYVGAAIREWPREPTVPVDAAGRPIVPTRFFCLPLDDFERCFGSYLALYRAVEERPFPEHDDEPLIVSARSRDEEVSSVRERLLDPRTAAAVGAVAAALLRGPVTLTPGYVSPRYSLEERIAFFDEVAALLPAGVRATLSAGTWVDNRTSHRIRLAFTQYLRDGAGQIDPDDPRDVNAVVDGHDDAAGRDHSPSRVYAVNLKRLRDGWGTDAVLRWLSEDEKPYSFNQPDKIVEALAVAERKILLGQTRGNSPSSLATERDALTEETPEEDASAPPEALAESIREHFRSLPPVDYLAAELLKVFLLGTGGFGAGGAIATDIELVRKHWVPAALPALLERCRQLVEVDADSRLLTALVGMAERLRCLPEILADFLLLHGGADEVGREIRDLVVDSTLDHRDDADGWRMVRDRLAADRAYTIHLLVRQMKRELPADGWDAPAPSGGRTLLGLLGWLEAADHPASRNVLRVLRALETSSFRQMIGADDIAALSGPDGAGDPGVQVLLERALRRGRFDQVLPVFEDWLTAASQRFDVRRRDEWASFLERPDIEIDSGVRKRLLKTAQSRSRRRLGLLRRGGDGGQAVTDSLPEGAQVGLEVQWMIADHPDRRDVRDMAWLAAHYRPAPPTGGALTLGEVSFFGDVMKNVAVAFHAPAGRLGRGEFLWCCYASHEEFVRARPRIARFYQAAQGGMRTPDAPQKLLRMAAPTSTAIADAIDTFGFGAVAATAALLLDGPVTIATPVFPVPSAPPVPSVPLRLRLAFLDTVLALLPIGMCSSLSACTWAYGDRIERFRIAFGDGAAGSGRHVVEWRNLPGIPPLRSGLARAYYRRLLLLRTLFHETRDIVHVLARDSAPLNLDIPDERFRVSMMFENMLFEPVREPETAMEKWSSRVDDVLAGNSGGDDDDIRTLEALLADGSLLDVEDTRSYARRLREQGRLDRVLGGLLGRKPKGAARFRRVQAGAVALAREFCADGWSPAGERRWPEVDRGLRRADRAPLEVAIQEMRAGSVEGLRHWLDRMDSIGDPPRILDPFRTLLIEARTPADIPDPARSPDGLRALLQLARRLDLQDGTALLPALLARLPDGWGQAAGYFRWFSASGAHNAPGAHKGALTRAGSKDIPALGGSGPVEEARENVSPGSELLLWRKSP